MKLIKRQKQSSQKNIHNSINKIDRFLNNLTKSSEEMDDSIHYSLLKSSLTKRSNNKKIQQKQLGIINIFNQQQLFLKLQSEIISPIMIPLFFYRENKENKPFRIKIIGLKRFSNEMTRQNQFQMMEYNYQIKKSSYLEKNKENLQQNKIYLSEKQFLVKIIFSTVQNCLPEIIQPTYSQKQQQSIILIHDKKEIFLINYKEKSIIKKLNIFLSSKQSLTGLFYQNLSIFLQINDKLYGWGENTNGKLGFLMGKFYDEVQPIYNDQDKQIQSIHQIIFMEDYTFIVGKDGTLYVCSVKKQYRKIKSKTKRSYSLNFQGFTQISLLNQQNLCENVRNAAYLKIIQLIIKQQINEYAQLMKIICESKEVLKIIKIKETIIKIQSESFHLFYSLVTHEHILIKAKRNQLKKSKIHFCFQEIIIILEGQVRLQKIFENVTIDQNVQKKYLEFGLQNSHHLSQTNINQLNHNKVNHNQQLLMQNQEQKTIIKLQEDLIEKLLQEKQINSQKFCHQVNPADLTIKNSQDLSQIIDDNSLQGYHHNTMEAGSRKKSETEIKYEILLEAYANQSSTVKRLKQLLQSLSE